MAETQRCHWSQTTPGLIVCSPYNSEASIKTRTTKAPELLCFIGWFVHPDYRSTGTLKVCPWAHYRGREGGDGLANLGSSSRAPLSSQLSQRSIPSSHWDNQPLPPSKLRRLSSLSVRDAEGSLVVASSLRTQEMGPALSNHPLRTRERVQRILVAQLQTSFPPQTSSDVFPGLHRMTQIRRNPKVDFEELLLPLQQDPATDIHPLVTPAPSSCD